MLYKDVATKRMRDMINDDCIVRVPPYSKQLPAMGGKGYYTWQFYLRKALLDANCLQVVSDDFWGRYDSLFKSQKFQLAGVESAATPIITAIVIEGARRGNYVNAFSIRKSRKEYGLRNLIEGAPSQDPVLFIDDLTSPQHNAFWHAVYALSITGLKLSEKGYVIVRKQQQSKSQIIETSLGKVCIDSLFTLDDFSLTLEKYHEEKGFF